MILLDEPLSALDAHTKDTVRAELHELLREFALPTILVTHDYEDAAALADQVGVLVDGKLRQLATPSELVDRPGRRVRRVVHRRQPAARDALADSTTSSRVVQLETRRGDLLDRPRRGRGRRRRLSVGGLGRAAARHDDSALNVIEGEIRSVVTVGNRVRVRVGPITAEVTSASAATLELARGGTAVATFKATGTRLVPLERELSGPS